MNKSKFLKKYHKSTHDKTILDLCTYYPITLYAVEYLYKRSNFDLKITEKIIINIISSGIDPDIEIVGSSDKIEVIIKQTLESER